MAQTSPVLILPLAVLSFAVTACGDKLDAESASDFEGDVFYDRDIKPILDANCIACHDASRSGAARNGAPSDVNLDSYAGAKASAERALKQMESGAMPPGGEISGEDLGKFEAWIAQGFPETAPSDDGGDDDSSGGTGEGTEGKSAEGTEGTTVEGTEGAGGGEGTEGTAEGPLEIPNVDDIAGKVVYQPHIRALFEQRCLLCHSIKNEGPARVNAPADVNFDTYELAKPLATRANEQIQRGEMAPGGLSLDERRLFQRWIDDGVLESE